MKQRLFAILLALALLLTTAGCSASGMEQKLDVAGNRIENRLDSVEDSVENALQRSAAPASAATQSAQITQEEAENIALEHAGFTADQVQYLRSEPDYDHGHKKFDVEFQVDRWEYDYEIHAETGEILSMDKDWDD